MSIEHDKQLEARQRIQQQLQGAEFDRIKKRLAYNVVELCAGNKALLFNNEIFRYLPEFLDQRTAGENGNDLDKLIETLEVAVCSHDSLLRERAVIMLSMLLQIYTEKKLSNVVKLVFTALCVWIREERELLPGYEGLCQQMGKTCLWMVNEHCFYESATFIMTLQLLKKNCQSRNKSIKAIAQRVCATLNTSDVHSKLYEKLGSAGNDELVLLQQNILHLGEPALHFGLNILVTNDDDKNKKRIIGLFARAGADSVNIVRQYIHPEMKWSVAIDLIGILRKIQKNDNFETVKPLLSHQDQRVQKEVVKYILKSEDRLVVQNLIEATKHLNIDVLRVTIKQLSLFHRPEISQRMVVIVQEILSGKRTLDIELLCSIVVGLSAYTDSTSLKTIQALSQIEGQLGYSEFKQIHKRAINSLETRLRHKAHRVHRPSDVSFSEDPVLMEEISSSLSGIDQEIKVLVRAGLAREAINLLIEQIEDYAKEKNFPAAEYLCEKILATDTGALPELFSAEALIRREKQSSVPVSFKKKWSELEGTLGQRGFANLYKVAEVEVYKSGDVIVREGDQDDHVFLIDSGTVIVTCRTMEEDSFIKRLKAGMSFGADVLFGISRWTVTVKAEEDTKLYTISRQAFKKVIPAETKLKETLYRCLETTDYSELILKSSGDDRRSEPRVSISVERHVYILDKYGKKNKRAIRCRLIDVSAGGFCCSIRIVNTNNTHFLLGKEIHSSVQIQDSGIMELRGEIVSVERENKRNSRVIIHVKLLKKLSLSQFSEIVQKY